MHHAGGASAVTVNQRADGSQLKLLGSYSLSLGAAHKVVLTSATNGAAVADAILVVAETAPESASFEWAPTLPSAGLVVASGQIVLMAGYGVVEDALALGGTASGLGIASASPRCSAATRAAGRSS